jgi:4a-hydroxytetrahydrobiopterin dehydratase
VPCRGGVPPLTGEEIEPYLADLGNGWEVADGHHLEKEYRFRDFREALDFTIRVGELAEDVGHHPDIELAWGRVKLTVWTHKIHRLHEADFVFAAKADAARADRLGGARVSRSDTTRRSGAGPRRAG